ncbi:MAG TPA: gluconate 2-dehydrogenase subunit 3 family protein, partial [Tepidisphaeraceae bacterium]|nr:gluconate 2-dehydrogenase subunit 3 family protein [Tepidisphaeraceae bacterium]
MIIAPFTPAQSAALVSAMDRIVPADEYPSASAAGVGQFIAGLMAGPLADRAAAFAAGLDALDAAARAHCGTDFAHCWPDVQDGLLAKLESGEDAAGRA